jgi:predicted RecA/RadA family phage recombinase
MAKAKYIQFGASPDYPNDSALMIEAASVIDFKTGIGIAGGDIPAGAVGTIHLTGIYDLPKEAGTAFVFGQALYYDAESGVVTAEKGTPCGFAIHVAAATDPAARVRLCPGMPPAPAAETPGEDA